jgi:NDP-sugar pyrophosphorylase family protein
MQAVILAGGLGTRLGPITATIPKPMVPVAGVPYLEHQLRLLERQSIRDVVLLTGYLGHIVEEYFGDGSRFGLRIHYSREAIPLGTGGAVRLAAPLLQDQFLIIYGDSYLPVDYRDVARSLNASGTIGLVVVYDNRLADTSVRNNIAVDTQGLVVRYDKEAENDTALAFVEAGVLAFRRSVVSLIPEGQASLEKQVFASLIAARQLRAYKTSQRFYDIGTPERVRIIEEFLSHDHHTDAFPH